jgi:hypothetical protein
VGLGRWPAKVRGILSNVEGQLNKIEARSGAVLTAPFAFEALYHEFADSWRVQRDESLLSACERELESGIPKKTFYAADLDRQAAKHARAVCTAAGVKDKTLLEACTLDVVVIGSEKAAQVFVGMRAPAAVGRVLPPRRGEGGDYEGKK